MELQMIDLVIDDEVKSEVQEYYGSTLQGSDDLQSNACCCDIDSIPGYQKLVLAQIHDEILTRYYGCGSPIPPNLEGCTVLDLGCGTGRDVYTASKLVGSKGKVIGVDMTDEQLDVARRHHDFQMEAFGYSESNVELLKGDIEDLAALDIDDNSVDVIISNCVINLATDKKKVYQEIFRVLKPGGELYFSDVFSNCRVPEEISTDPIMYGECLGGTLYVEDFRRLMNDCGWADFRNVSCAPITINNPLIEKKAGNVKFLSATIRAFKLNSLEDKCEDYGQVAVYNGTIQDSEFSFKLDDHHTFITGKPMLVCGNTAAMVSETRYADHFTVHGDRSTHFGLFDDCAPGDAPISDGGLSCC